MTNSEIKKRLPKSVFNIEYTNFEEFCEIGKKLSEVYSYNFDYSKQAFDRQCEHFEEALVDNKKYVKNLDEYHRTKGGYIKVFRVIFPNKYNENFEIFSTISNVNYFPNYNLSQKVFLKYFEEDYSDELEYIELSQYEKGLLKISINKFVQHCENFGDELLNFDLDNYGKILDKL